MSYKILTKNGVDNTNIDGARAEHFNSGMRDGIVKGALNEGTFGTNSSNSIFLDSCELRISGHRIVINEPVYKTFINAPSSNVRYAYIAQIIVDDNSNVEFSLLVQSANTKLIQDNLFKTTNGKGTYQIEIGRFTLQTDGTITDIVRTIDVITGGAWQGSGINVGNVTTNVIDLKLLAEVDIDQRYEVDEGKSYLDFKFNLPIDLTGVDDAAKNAYENSASAVATSNEANARSKTAETTANEAKTISDQAKTNSESAVSTANSAKTIAEISNTTSLEAKTLATKANEKSNSAIADSSTALTTANSANTKSDSAIEKSEQAVSTANSANTKSDTALTNSETAVTNANSAIEKSNTALSNSDLAIDTATNAETVANGIDAKATEALTNSKTAIDTANSANAKADTATTTANTSNTVANQAKETADDAHLIADSAMTVSSAAAETANSADTLATEAKKIADEAKAQSNTAVSTSTSANITASNANTKSDTAVSTANDAKKLAEQAVSGQGTKVTVGGNFTTNYEINDTALSQLKDDTTHRTVTDLEKTTWNNKQSALTFDVTPTLNSTNPVNSNGIYTALNGILDNHTLIFSNISTLNTTSSKFAQLIAGYKFSDYRLLIFGMYNTSGGWVFSTITPDVFKSFSAKKGTLNVSKSDGFWITQSISDENRRIKLGYITETTFNIYYANNCHGLAIIGVR